MGSFTLILQLQSNVQTMHKTNICVEGMKIIDKTEYTPFYLKKLHLIDKLMKQLILIRHGKSSWSHDVTDDLRPLTKRGKNDIKLITKYFNTLNLKPDQLFSSPARRAFDTASMFYSGLELPQKPIIKVETLYDFEGSQVVSFIKALSNDYNFVIIFGHNHAFTSISNIFGSKVIDNLPTAGLVHLYIDVDKWSDINKGITKLTIFPKQLRND
mgnify:CR=1 FL=1